MTQEELHRWLVSPATKEVLRVVRNRFPRNYRATHDWGSKMKLDGHGEVLELFEDEKQLWDTMKDATETS